jgi:hypothetical protein
VFGTVPYLQVDDSLVTRERVIWLVTYGNVVVGDPFERTGGVLLAVTVTPDEVAVFA